VPIVPIVVVEELTMNESEQIVRAGEEALVAMKVEEAMKKVGGEAYLKAIMEAKDKVGEYLKLVLKVRGDRW
jgi:hypothetical protein